jgi:hypothetical protein
MKKSIVIAIVFAAIMIPAAVYTAGPLFINTHIDEPSPNSNASKTFALSNNSTLAGTPAGMGS